MYYCKNCGSAYEVDEAVICIKCGTEKGAGSSYCQSCGSTVESTAEFCFKCGCKLNNAVHKDAKIESNIFCRVCGNEIISKEAVICVKCGSPKGSGRAFCWKCGKPTETEQSVCLKCGCSLSQVSSSYVKSKLIAGLLAIFLGWIGIHNFYLEYTQKAIIQAIIGGIGFLLSWSIGGLILFGTFIWGLIDGIFIFTDKIIVDGKGNPIKKD